MELFSSVCTAEIYIMKFHFLYHLVENVSSLGHVPAQDASVYEHSIVYTKSVYQWLPGKRPTRLQQTVTLTEWQQRIEQARTSAKVGR